MTDQELVEQELDIVVFTIINRNRFRAVAMYELLDITGEAEANVRQSLSRLSRHELIRTFMDPPLLGWRLTQDGYLRVSAYENEDPYEG